jgi:putative spermidine/putrescine transport system substrate-binding protein
MSFGIGRRQFLLSGTAAAATLGTLSLVSSANAERVTIRSTHFGGPYQVLSEIIGRPYEQATQNRVIYDAEISPTIFPKIQTQLKNPPFDVVMLSRAWGLRAQKAGLLQTVSTADFPEAKKVMNDVMPAGGWGISTMMDTMDIMVDTKQVTTPITSWMDLWRSDLKGKVMLPSSTEGSTAFAFLACIINAVGGDITSQAAVDEAFARLKALKPNLRGFFSDGTQPNILIERGDVAVVPQYAIRIANTSRKVAHVKKASPKEGMLAVPYDLCIPLNVKNPEVAKQYINFTLTKSVQEAVAKTLMATPVRSDIVIPPEVAPFVNADPKLIWFQDAEYAAQKEREWLDRYTREIQG